MVSVATRGPTQCETAEALCGKPRPVPTGSRHAPALSVGVGPASHTSTCSNGFVPSVHLRHRRASGRLGTLSQAHPFAVRPVVPPNRPLCCICSALAKLRQRRNSNSCCWLGRLSFKKSPYVRISGCRRCRQATVPTVITLRRMGHAVSSHSQRMCALVSAGCACSESNGFPLSVQEHLTLEDSFLFPWIVNQSGAAAIRDNKSLGSASSNLHRQLSLGHGGRRTLLQDAVPCCKMLTPVSLGGIGKERDPIH